MDLFSLAGEDFLSEICRFRPYVMPATAVMASRRTPRFRNAPSLCAFSCPNAEMQSFELRFCIKSTKQLEITEFLWYNIDGVRQQAV